MHLLPNRRPHVRNSLNHLISSVEIVLLVNVVADPQQDHRSRNHQRSREQSPVADELGLEGDLLGVQAVGNGGSGRLDPLVKTDVVRAASTRVGECADEPFVCQYTWPADVEDSTYQ